MASLFEQYEQASQRHRGISNASARPSMSTTGFINMRLEEDVPIFFKQKMNFKATHSITHLIVSNNQLVLAMANKMLLWIDLLNPDKPKEFPIGKFCVQVCHLFMDPLGQHLLVSVKPNDTATACDLLYISQKSTKPKLDNKLKDHIVTAVAWNFSNSDENVTGPVLLGTSKGLIFETELVSGDERRFRYLKQVFDIGKGQHIPIMGLEYHWVPGIKKYFVIATTVSRFYQFVGYIPGFEEKPLLQQVFNNYLNEKECYLDFPSTLNYSRLEFFYPAPRRVPKTFAWMTERGILYGQINQSLQTLQNTVTVETELLQFPQDEDPQEESVDPTSGKSAEAIALMEFHVLLLYRDRVKGICVLNEQLIFEDVYNEAYGNLVGITKDPVKGTLWAFSEGAVFKYKVEKEARNVWQVYVEKGDFELAKLYCQENRVHLDQVLIQQAEDCFSKKNYEESAIHYAKTQSSFEEVTLKFLQANQKEALKKFLLEKLHSLKLQDKTQMTMIIIWVIELYLNQLGTLRDRGEEKSEEYEKVREEFISFLRHNKVKDCVSNNRGTVYDLLASHGDKDNIINFTILMRDYERVIKHHIQNNSYTSALEALQKQNNMDLFYHFAPALMQTIPKQTVAVLIALGRRLTPSKLIPALVMYDHSTGDAQGNEAIHYLEFCVNELDNRDQAIHNYLLSLYARLKSDRLMIYLKFQGQDPNTICYDLKYALRLCLEENLDEACVHIYTTMGLYEEAVDLALKFNIELAKENANMTEDNEELRKKLWLKIARHVVKEKNDIKQAMEFLQQCDLIKIEDILPFFPDFVTIDHFKDAICSSLQEYNQHIQDLKEEMEEATRSAEVIRKEIQAFRNKYAFVKGEHKCSVCGYPLLTRPFYLFPCGHQFHSDCLTEEVQPHLTAPKRNRLQDVQRQLAAFSGKEDIASLSSTAPSPRDQVKADLDEIVASECLLCGDIMIRSIDRPFIEGEEYDRVMKEWE